MDVVSLIGYVASAVVPVVIYFLVFKKDYEQNEYYSGNEWFYPIKMYFARDVVKSYKKKCKDKVKNFGTKVEYIKRFKSDKHSHSQYIRGVDQKGNSTSLKFTIINKTAEVHLVLRLANGSIYTYPGGQNFHVTSIREGFWKINGLSIETLEPYVRLRIIFNGILRDVSCDTYEKVEHVQFNFIFNASGSPSFFPQDTNTNLLADTLAKTYWKDASWKDFMSRQSTGYDQFGSLLGIVKGDSFKDDLILNLPACRSKYTGLDDRFSYDRDVRIFIVDNEGILLNIVAKLIHKSNSQLKYGYAIHENNSISIKEVDLNLHDVASKKNVPDTLVTHFSYSHKEFRSVLHLNTNNIVICTNSSRNGCETFNVIGDCDLNTMQAKVIVDFWYNNPKNADSKENIFIPQAILSPKTVEALPDVLVSNIKSEESKILDLTGGKGNSLALLSSLNSNEFIVPGGFVITVNSFRSHINNSFKLKKLLENLDSVCCGRKEGILETHCAEVVDAFKNEPIDPHIIQAIIKEIRLVKEESFNDGIDVTRWAVRSSAIGEDSEELSAAGQNDTILGLTTEEDVLKAVSSCWASLYAYQSVHYRWQHGMPVISDMAVVVQKMVPSDAAGVLFTWHPSTSNPSQMVVTANYGLGESVVSGKSDPDTFILNRTYDGKVCLLDHYLGAKNTVIKMTDNGVEETTFSDDSDGFEIVESKNLCLTKEQAVNLGKIGVLLEKSFGDARDIEWAFYKGKLYLLQSRPITTLNTWSDFELTHEFDWPVLSENNVYTVANVGEVFPNVVTPLTLSSTVAITDKGVQLQVGGVADKLVNKTISTFNFKTMLDVMIVHKRSTTKDDELNAKLLDLAIFGHPVIEERIQQSTLYRWGKFKGLDKLKETLKAVYLAYNNRQTLLKAVEITKHLDLSIDDDHSLEETYQKISKSFENMTQVAQCHSCTTFISVFYQVVCMTVLMEKNKDLTMEHYADFAAILSSCEDVVSAEIPMQLEEIGRVIRDEGYNEEFCTLKPEFGVEWLRRKCPEAYKLFRKFLTDHGHRLLGEFEIMEDSWGTDPSKIIPMIQANAKNERVSIKQNKTVHEVVKSLVSPKSSVTKKIVKFIMSKLRVAVGIREQTKSELVRSFNKLRIAYKKLGEKLEKNGNIPSKDLIFFLTHYELGEIINKKCPILLNKAVRRKKLYPQWNKCRYPEIMYGYPQAENEDDVQIDFSGKSVSGTPVCTGSVKGRACVITSLDEIGQLEKGDILITYSTDIGWSPYFPTLSGIVTELGGLVSHGAVVAREYGLPCIVGIRNVTKMFKTGDIVYLSGKTGELGKV